MKFTPRSEADIKRDMLIPAGEYDFTVTKAEEKTSNSGNQMIALELIVFCDGRQYYVRDWLMVDLPMQQYKVLHFCQATGLSERYHNGELTDSDCVNRSGQLKLGIREDKTGQYGPQNNVKDYISDSVQGPGDEPQVERVLAGKAFDPNEEYPF